MVKLLSLIAITGGMAATSSSAEGGGIRLQSIVTSNQPRMDDTTITTEDLELATRQFVESNIGKIRIVSNRDIDGKKSRRLNSEPSTRHERTSEHVTLDVNVGNNWSSGKSGKESTSTTVAGITSEEVFYLLPLACPSKCVSSWVTKESEMTDSLDDCYEIDTTQMWLVRSDSSYVMIESYDCPGMCIAVDYEIGDSDQMIDETCYNGELMLKDCNSSFGTEWYFTGGQLINSFCWGMGTSSTMTIFMNNGVCESSVAVFGLDEEAIMKADTFMFVNRLPHSPIFAQMTASANIEDDDDVDDDDDDDDDDAAYVEEVKEDGEKGDSNDDDKKDDDKNKDDEKSDKQI